MKPIVLPELRETVFDGWNSSLNGWFSRFFGISIFSPILLNSKIPIEWMSPVSTLKPNHESKVVDELHI